jgi:predicted transcriptional regulator
MAISQRTDNAMAKIKKDAKEEAEMQIKAFSVVHNKQLGTVTVTGVPKKLEE